MELMDKLTILADSAKYDAACTSSGVDRAGVHGSIGSAANCGICHSFSADGRCISLLKILMTNSCVYDCHYCVNRRSNDIERATFTPHELAELTISFYRRNYIEGLFLSSGVLKNPDYTCERMIEALNILRNEYRFGGYIHAKAIPGADPRLLDRLGVLADRMSINIELPSQKSLEILAPDKSKHDIIKPMGYISDKIKENKGDIVKYNHAPSFSKAGQATQMIIGATPDTDYQIINLSAALYNKYQLKRVFYSAYMPVISSSSLPALNTPPPLLREHRLYQADWLLRFYGFSANEILDEEHPDLNPYIDPKCNWAINHIDMFPIEINTASYEMLLRVPGIGTRSAARIVKARRTGSIDFAGLKKIGAVLKRAQYFVTCNGKINEGLKITQDGILRSLISERCHHELPGYQPEQLSLFLDPSQITREDVQKCLTGQI